jgi:hypothetical protein
MIPNQTIKLHHELLTKKNMLVELSIGNYIMSNGLINDANGIFEDYRKCLQNRLYG